MEPEQPYQFTIDSSSCGGCGHFPFGKTKKGAFGRQTVSARTIEGLVKALQAVLQGQLAEDKYPGCTTLRRWEAYWRNGTTKGRVPPPWLVRIVWNGKDLGARPQAAPAPPKNKKRRSS